MNKKALPAGAVSYAQNFEDVLLWRVLKNVQNGNYIDVGAQDPEEGSVSKLFFEHGWRGVHVEPVDAYAESLRRARQGDQVVQAVLARHGGLASLFVFENTGLSTVNEDVAAMHVRDGRQPVTRLVPAIRLSDVFQFFEGREIHWIKIDVEGSEGEVLDGWGQSSARPWIVVIESTLPGSLEEVHDRWESKLTGRGYLYAYFDGINRFYVHETARQLLEKLRYGPCILDNIQVTENAGFCANLRQELNALRSEVQALRLLPAAVEESKRLEVVSALEGARRELGYALDRLADSEARAVRIQQDAETTRRSLEESSARAIESVRQELTDALNRIDDSDAQAAESRRQADEANGTLKAIADRAETLERDLNSLREQLRRTQTRYRGRFRVVAHELRRERERGVGLTKALAVSVESLQTHRAMADERARVEEVLLDRYSTSFRTMETRLDEIGNRIAAVSDRVLGVSEAQPALSRAAPEDNGAEQLANQSPGMLAEIALLNEKLRRSEALSIKASANLQEVEAELRRVVAQKTEAIGVLQRRVDALHGSRSWRLTAPLRGVSRFLRGGSVGFGVPQVGRRIVETRTALDERSPVKAWTLLAVPDSDFLRTAYVTILGREPDPSGLTSYGSALARGVAKPRILWRLSRSREGRAKGVDLNGLTTSVMMSLLSKIPFIARLLPRSVREAGSKEQLDTLYGELALLRERLQADPRRHVGVDQAWPPDQSTRLSFSGSLESEKSGGGRDWSQYPARMQWILEKLRQ